VEEDEMEQALKAVVGEAAGQVPVYSGIGDINTKRCVRLAKMTAANGAAASILRPIFLRNH